MGKEILLESDRLLGSSYPFFKEMKDRGKFCDVVLRFKKESISAHRIIIASAIPLLSEQLIRNEETEVTMTEVDDQLVTSFKQLIDFAYTGKLSINGENVKNFLVASYKLQMDEVRDACCTYMVDNLSPEYVIGVRGLPELSDCKELGRKIDGYIKENFSKISVSRDFVNCPLDFLKELIASDDLKVSQEEEVFEAVMHWIKYSEERQKHLAELMRYVRLTMLDHSYLRRKVLKDDLVSKSPQCRNLVDEATDYNWALAHEGEPKPECSFPTHSRNTENSESSGGLGSIALYAFSAEVQFNIKRFNQRTNTWHVAKEDKFAVNTAVVTEVQNSIWFMDCENMCYYSPQDNSVNFVKRYLQGRASTSVDKDLYVFGGSDGFEVFRTAELFNSDEERWEELEPMQMLREYAGCVTLDNYVYVLGGDNAESVHCSVERYNLKTVNWDPLDSVADMITPRCGFGCAVLKGEIYICGGVTCLETQESLDSTEVYDPVVDQWKMVKSRMRVPRQSFTLLPYAGKLFALGGKDDDYDFVNEVEVYNRERDSWKRRCTMQPDCQITGFAVVKN